MSKLNCPNCGAPIEPENNKCSYCGTSYFDLSAIDIDDQKPFYLKFKTRDMIVTQLVRVDDISMTMTSDNYYNSDGIRCYHYSPRVDIDMQFHVVNDKGKLYTIHTTK